MKKLNSHTLKLIAIIAMTIDHVADLWYPGMPNNIICVIMHLIGRLTAPIMFFFICEGFFYTKNLKKYIIRLFILVLYLILLIVLLLVLILYLLVRVRYLIRQVLCGH